MLLAYNSYVKVSNFHIEKMNTELRNTKKIATKTKVLKEIANSQQRNS